MYSRNLPDLSEGRLKYLRPSFKDLNFFVVSALDKTRCCGNVSLLAVGLWEEAHLCRMSVNVTPSVRPSVCLYASNDWSMSKGLFVKFVIGELYGPCFGFI